MPPQSSPLNPNARPFPYPPPHLRPATRFPNSRFATSPTRSLAPLARSGTRPTPPPPPRLTPLASVPCAVLDRERTHNFGPEGFLPRPSNAVQRVQAASDEQWARYRLGYPTLVRPGSVVAPQTIYTGSSTRPDGQEIHHAVFLNSRMLIHNPTTGRPGMINGHAVATLVAAPSTNQPWSNEVPYPTAAEVRKQLSRYGPATQAEVGRQRREGQFQLGVNRQAERVPSLPDATSGSMETVPRAPTLPPVSLPPISPARQSLPFRQPLPSFQAVLRSTQSRGPFFLTHPQDVRPRVDVRGMTDRGTALDTGHRVLQLPFHPPNDTGMSLPKRIDTPAPPLRLLTGPPVIVEEAADSTSDESMPPVSPKDPKEELGVATSGELPDDEAAPKEQHESTSTTAQKWAASNARLERLRYAAKQCAMAQRSSNETTPTYVFGAYPTSQVRKVQDESTTRDSDAMEVDPESDEEGGSKTHRSPVPGTAPLIPNPRDPRDRRIESRTSDPRGHSATSLSSLSTTASNSQNNSPSALDDSTSPQLLSKSPAETASNPDSSYFDCRSTASSPQQRAANVGDDSDSDQPPSLVSPPSEEGELQGDAPVDGSQAYAASWSFSNKTNGNYRLVRYASAPSASASSSATPASSAPVATTTVPVVASLVASTSPAQNATSPAPHVPGTAFSVYPRELDGYLERIVRAPPTPSNRNWVLIQEWTRNQGNFIARLYKVENADALAFLRKADAFIRQHPDLLDIQRMRANELIDTDLVNVLQHPDITTESCTQFARRLQRTRDSINAYSPGLMDSTRAIPDIVYIPVSADGNRKRQLSDQALNQPLMYRYALLLIAKQHLDWIAWYTELRRFVLAFIRYLDELFRRRRWELDETLLHQPAPIPPPYLHPFEYHRLRVLLYTFDAHGQDDVVRVIEKFLRYRFRDTEIVAHLLFAGLFETNDVVRDNEGGFKTVSPRRAFTSFRASPFQLQPFLTTYPGLQELQRAAAASRS
ncbi:hypothetical protein C8R47DRAFT_1208540 [Mycena vitilis]|nr:hypothetical protein C8R47DRAFT_1208540 [Mycena vitilis]